MNNIHLENQLLRICSQPRTLEYITNQMGGLDPIKILEILNSLTVSGVLNFHEDYWSLAPKDELEVNENLLAESEMPLKKYMGHFDFLKNPHPLDFEWRNTLKSLNFLTDLVEKVNLVNDKILILGMPTLFANCSIRNITRNITLVERNKPIVNSLRKFEEKQLKVIEKDIFNAKPEEIGKFYSVFMDPPWYSNFLYQFVWLGANCLEPGGIMVISIPPINTRNNISEERIKWFSFCQKQGLCIEKLEPERLEYAMPFFEYNAFRTAGASNVLPFWRKGDLVFFRKMSKKATKRPNLDFIPQNWKEFEFENVRIRVNLDSDNVLDQKLTIESLTKNDILPSVSRSNNIRKMANIWTSGNRIFRTNNVNIFEESLRKKNNQLVNNWLKMILELESNEYKNYLAHIYYEMERQPT